MTSESNKVTVRPLRHFLGEEGNITPESPPFEVSRQRAAELRANGLVEIVEGEKAAPPPANKKALEPENKAAHIDEGKNSGRRGREG